MKTNQKNFICSTRSTTGLSAVPCCPGKSMPEDAPVHRRQAIFIDYETQGAGDTLYELLGKVELMRVAYEKGELKSAQQRLEIMVKEAAVLSSKFSSILDRDEHVSGSFDTKSRGVDVAELLQEVSRESRALVEGKPVTVMAVDYPLPVIINADSNKIRYIMMGLVNNAVKYTERGRITLIISTEKNEIRLTVADTGKGMTQEQIAVVQKAPQIDHEADMADFGRISPGLRSAAALAKQLQGSIALASRLGEGTIAALVLPLKCLK